MSNRSSQQTPKGRINVRFEVDTNGQKQDVSLPYKVLYVGDLSGDTVKADLRQRDPLAIDLDTFDEVMKELRPSLELEVEDHISGVQGATAGIKLEFKSLADFTPDRLMEMVPELKQLKGRYDALAAIRYPLDADRGDLTKKIAELLAARRNALQTHYNPPAGPANDPAPASHDKETDA